MSANCCCICLLRINYDDHKNKISFEVMWRRTYVCLPIVVERVYCAAIMTIIKKDLIQSYVTMYLRMSANCRWLGLRCTNYDHHKNKTSFEVLWRHTYVYLPIVFGWVYCAAIMTIIKNKTSFEVMWHHAYVCLPIIVGWVYFAAIMTIIKARPHSRLYDAVPTYVCQLSLVGFIMQQLWPS